MVDSDRPRSPFAGVADLSVRLPLRVLSSDEIEQMLASHRRYLDTEYHEGHRANFASVDLTGSDFSGLNLRASRWIVRYSAGLISLEPTCKAPI